MSAEPPRHPVAAIGDVAFAIVDGGRSAREAKKKNTTAVASIAKARLITVQAPIPLTSLNNLYGFSGLNYTLPRRRRGECATT
jgi:hypothetical protein